ncbi:hypothetical protein B4N89_37740 [Embleya scabrispora]|uniref:Uncharacterized protein n=1 Tax=Embleya scabrispora TaxID=159449 RepID=A0A1T3NMF5_9ACTN|nr:hypothetical protein B4N89_37740 [Embleya scabrispora]
MAGVMKWWLRFSTRRCPRGWPRSSASAPSLPNAPMDRSSSVSRPRTGEAATAAATSSWISLFIRPSRVSAGRPPARRMPSMSRTVASPPYSSVPSHSSSVRSAGKVLAPTARTTRPGSPPVRNSRCRRLSCRTGSSTRSWPPWTISVSSRGNASNSGVMSDWRIHEISFSSGAMSPK